ncbi:hypothetical protein SteCoe_37747 [Stentor coeruleus]|uniref:Uncharacterized protein n=1 Tax=Stentor coeruleus TaxID=5963 RepID=A0A1R2AMF8_9CILI|nr:hypothetical protein SteCoe_37747 [Stentor coeruleus]
MKFVLVLCVFVSILASWLQEEKMQSFLGLSEIEALLEELEEKTASYADYEYPAIMLNVQEDSDDIKTGDELGIRAGGEPPLKTGEAPRNTIVASTKMRFKIPDMNA